MAATVNMARQSNHKQFNGVAPEAFAEGLVDHDMHLKMSKKIAQLTKVIYALNTKNDEHEHIIKQVQLQHEKEKTQLLEGTKSRIESLKGKIATESQLQERIRDLEHCIEEHMDQKKKILHQFDSFKGESADQEFRLHAQYEAELQKLSSELTQSKTEFEQKSKTFESLIDAFDHEKSEALNDLKKAHQLEIDHLMKSQQTESSSIALELQALKSQYADEMSRHQSLHDLLRGQKNEMEADYEAKLKKSKDFYEKELELLRQNQNSTALESQKYLQDKLDKLTKDFQFQEKQYEHRIDNLLTNSANAEELLSDLRSQIATLTSESSSSLEEMTELRSQLDMAKRDLESASQAFKETQRELQVLKDRYNEQSQELVKKSGTIGELTAMKADRESRIRQLEDELATVASRLKILQDEKDSLLSKSSNEAQEKSKEVQSLERALEDLRIEKQAQRDKYEVELTSLEKKLANELEDAHQRSSENEDKLRLSHNDEMAQLLQSEESKRIKLESDWSRKLDNEVSKLQQLNQELNADHQGQVTDLKQKLAKAEEEIEALMRRIGDTADGLGAATSELTQLRDQAANLRQQLDKSKIELQSSNNEVNKLKFEVETLKATNKQQSKEHAAELERKLKELSDSLEEIWMQKLRAECQKLRLELERQFSSDRDSSMRHLTAQRDAEIERLKTESQQRAMLLNNKISELERSLRAEIGKQEQVEQMKRDYERQLQELQKEIDGLLMECEVKYQKITEEIKEQHRAELVAKEKEIEDALLDLKSKHVQDMSAQISAHKSAMEMIRKEADNLRLSELERVQSKYSQETESICSNLLSIHQKELEVNNQNFSKQLMAARMELQRAVELRNQKERELNDAKEELNGKITSKEWTIRGMETDLKKLEESVKQLNREIEVKGEEILNIRSDANRQLRKREEALVRQHANDLERERERHQDETSQVLQEFTKAQNILKNKIDELAELLEEAEDRYRNREPREEDLNMIEQLRMALRNREQEMEQLISEKQYYQMELVNRETNFTKVFAGSKGSGPNQPQVGFINPLAKKKKGDKGPTKFTVNSGMEGAHSNSNSAGSHKLRPIAGSPIHDAPINPNHVLPTPQAFTKKFVQ